MFQPHTLPALSELDGGPGALEAAVERLSQQAAEALDEGCSILILSDRGVDARRVPIPVLLALSAVHQRLVRDGIRMQTGLLVETAEAREVHHLAAPLRLRRRGGQPLPRLRHGPGAGRLGRGRSSTSPTPRRASSRRIAEGLLKVMSKMGISTLQSYRGAQIFEAVGLDRALIDKHFTGTPSRLGGIGLAELRREAAGAARPRLRAAAPSPALPVGGFYQWRRRGEHHRWNPTTLALLQAAVRAGGLGALPTFSAAADDETRDASHPARAARRWPPTAARRCPWPRSSRRAS